MEKSEQQSDQIDSKQEPLETKTTEEIPIPSAPPGIAPPPPSEPFPFSEAVAGKTPIPVSHYFPQYYQPSPYYHTAYPHQSTAIDPKAIELNPEQNTAEKNYDQYFPVNSFSGKPMPFSNNVDFQSQPIV